MKRNYFINFYVVSINSQHPSHLHRKVYPVTREKNPVKPYRLQHSLKDQLRYCYRNHNRTSYSIAQAHDGKPFKVPVTLGVTSVGSGPSPGKFARLAVPRAYRYPTRRLAHTFSVRECFTTCLTNRSILYRKWNIRYSRMLNKLNIKLM